MYSLNFRAPSVTTDITYILQLYKEYYIVLQPPNPRDHHYRSRYGLSNGQTSLILFTDSIWSQDITLEPLNHNIRTIKSVSDTANTWVWVFSKSLHIKSKRNQQRPLSKYLELENDSFFLHNFLGCHEPKPVSTCIHLQMYTCTNAHPTTTDKKGRQMYCITLQSTPRSAQGPTNVVGADQVGQ